MAEPVTSQSGSAEIRCRIRMNWRIKTAHKIIIQAGKGQTRNANAWNPQEYEYKSPVGGPFRKEIALARKCKTTNVAHIEMVVIESMVGVFIFQR